LGAPASSLGEMWFSKVPYRQGSSSTRQRSYPRACEVAAQTASLAVRNEGCGSREEASDPIWYKNSEDGSWENQGNRKSSGRRLGLPYISWVRVHLLAEKVDRDDGVCTYV